MLSRTSDKIVKAVAALCKLHGLPNRFAASEIAFEANLTPLVVGRAFSAWQSTVAVEIKEALEAEGIEATDYGVQPVLGTAVDDRGPKYLTVKGAK